MAVFAHRGPAPQHSAHVDHGARADHGPDVDDGPHHDDGALPDLHLLSDDGSRLNAGIYALEIQQGDGAVAAVVFNHQILDFSGVFRQNRPQLTPVAEYDLAAAASKDLGGAVVDGLQLVDIGLDRGFLLRAADIGDDLLSVHCFPPNRMSWS